MNRNKQRGPISVGMSIEKEMQCRQTLSGRYSMFFVRVAMRQGLIVVEYV